MKKPSGQNSTGDGTPDILTSTGDDTPGSVGDGTPQPPPDRPFGCIFNPTDPAIISLLNRKIHNLPVTGDMVNKAFLYKVTPNLLVKRLHPYIVDGFVYYLVFTKTKVIRQDRHLGATSKKLRRHRNVGKGLMGYWRPHGDRAFITDQNHNVVGSKLRFTYDDGHLRHKEKGMQRSVWNMYEYQIVSKEKNTDHLKYTICKLYKDSSSSHSKAFLDREVQKSIARNLKNEILTLEHRRDSWDHKEAKDMMEADIRCSIAICNTLFEYEQELVDKFQTSKDKKNWGLARAAERISHDKDKDAARPKSSLFEPLKYGKEILSEFDPSYIPSSTCQKWNGLKYTEVEQTKWEKTPEGFTKNEEGQVFFSSIAYLDWRIDKHFMALLLCDRSQLGIRSMGWLASEHICTWINYLMRDYRSSLINARWTILMDNFDKYLAPDSYVNGVAADSSDDEGVEVEGMIDDGELEVTKAKDVTWSFVGKNWPDLSEVDYVYTPINRYSHWYLAKWDLQSFNVTIYDSLHGHHWKDIEKRVRVKWAKKLPKLLDELNFWEKSGQLKPETLKIRVERDDNVPLQEGGGDCGVMVCRNLEMLVMGKPLDGEGKSGLDIGSEYRKKMAHTIYATRYLRPEYLVDRV